MAVQSHLICCRSHRSLSATASALLALSSFSLTCSELGLIICAKNILRESGRRAEAGVGPPVGGAWHITIWERIKSRHFHQCTAHLRLDCDICWFVLFCFAHLFTYSHIISIHPYHMHQCVAPRLQSGASASEARSCASGQERLLWSRCRGCGGLL